MYSAHTRWYYMSILYYDSRAYASTINNTHTETYADT